MISTVVYRLQASRFAREVLLVAGAYMAYEIVRMISAGQTLAALENAELLVRAEQALGIFVELEYQVGLLSYGLLVDFFSLWYFWGHFPLIIVFATWAFYRHRRHYHWTRNAVFVSGAIALLVYLTFPVAPPRLLPGAGFVDTLKDVFALQYEDSGLVNHYAALPSMHQGFAVIIGVALYRIIGGRRGLLLLGLLPTLMLISIIATGNHWILDAVFGAAAALIGMAIATHFETHGARLVAPLRRRLPPPFRRRLPRT